MASFKFIDTISFAYRFESLLKSSNMSDVVLVVGDKELRVHKLVLSTRSPVFAAMFSHSTTKEAQENRVQIVDVDVEVLKLFVNYIYTGKVFMLEHYAVDLLVVADKYQLNCLKSVCEQQLLFEVTTTDTVCDLLLFGDMYQVSELCRKCLKYITDNGTEVVASKGWMKIAARHDLMAKLYELLHSKYSKVVNSNDKKKENKVSGTKCNLRLDLELKDLLKYSNVIKCKEEMLDVAGNMEQLSEVITFESVSDLLILADMHCATELYTKCLDYITENGTQVMATEGWKKIRDRADYLDMLFEHLSVKYSKVMPLDDDEHDYDYDDPYVYTYFRDYRYVRDYESIYKKMFNQYESLLESGKLSDVVLVVGDKEISVHKVILSARSPVFAAMFAHASTKEAQENRVDIIDLDVEVVELLVRFIYGKVAILEEYVADLLIAADKYQIYNLKSICTQQLLCQVTTESASELFIFAEMYPVTELYCKCLDFITEKGTQVMASEGWMKIVARTDLLAQLYERLCSKYSKFIIANAKCPRKLELKNKLEYTDRKCTFGPDFDFQDYLLKYSNVINCKEVMSDVVLVVGGTELKVHKQVLSTRSPVFASMFSHNSTKEAQKNIVEITGVNADVLKLLIKYIYTGNVENLNRYAVRLFVAAEKYQLVCLKQICVQRLLAKVITSKSVLNLLIIADKYQITELYNKCIDFISNNETQVMASEGWKKVQVKVDLLAKICERLNLDFSKQLLLCPITVESVANLLIFADLHCATELTTNCFDYITDNVVDVMQEEDWKKMVLRMRADLLAELFKRLSLKYTQLLNR